TETTFMQRTKEEADDYRYFADPDLVAVEVDEKWLTELKGQIGELPRARRQRYVSQLGLNEKDAATLAGDKATGDLFDAIVKGGAEPKRASTLIEAIREVASAEGKRIAEIGIRPDFIAGIATLVAGGKLAASKEIAKQVIAVGIAEPTVTAEAAATKLGLIQSTDTSAVDAAIDAVLAMNPPALADFKAGKQTAIGALVGMTMKQAKGLNAKVVQERLRAKIGV
ncbi:Asp-tRNA(Asn)/Glu-tRNA(Gln) amidotransferase GatCAB subunit B, partial [bacterium]